MSNNTSIFQPVPQQDNPSFWRNWERFPAGTNHQVQTLPLAPVAQKSQPQSLHSQPFYRENKLHACAESKDSQESIPYVLESMANLADEEKLLLLNKTTELRRLNQNLLKLNMEWDHIYRTSALQMQQKVSALKMEVASLKQCTERLIKKIEYEQNKKEYYKQTLLQEFQKNEQLQEHVRQLENKLYLKNERRTLVNFLEDYDTVPTPLTRKSVKDKGQKTVYCEHHLDVSKLEKETAVLEAEPLTQYKDPEQMKAKNENVSKKGEEMRPQMTVLQDELKMSEDDFWKEHGDKQAFQQPLNNSRGANTMEKGYECKVKEKLTASAIVTSSWRKSGSGSDSGSGSKQYEPHTLKSDEGTKLYKKHDSVA